MRVLYNLNLRTMVPQTNAAILLYNFEYIEGTKKNKRKKQYNLLVQ
ncbi:hypothetical protein BACIH_0668 [Bacillus amyloliquefaciens]|nr:hypothetical protein U471_06940 [Bacillus amyloliquefaciens CC178]QEY92446.1 hypothetical protein BACIH_0668 [Bacillus amyloliquefaciens]